MQISLSPSKTVGPLLGPLAPIGSATCFWAPTQAGRDSRHLRVMIAQPEYLLAMKCLALRIGAEFHDEDDIRYLLRHLGVATYDKALELLARYYPLERFPQKTLCALGELLPKAG